MGFLEDNLVSLGAKYGTVDIGDTLLSERTSSTPC